MAHTNVLTRAHRRDIPRLAELWAHAFPGERTVEQRIHQLEAGGVFGGVESAWYVERDGLLAGAVRGYALVQHIHGTPMKMLGVAAVAVAAHARRQGLAAELCRQLLQLGRERGDLISALYPFRPSFYQRLGWGLAGSLHAYRFRTASLPVLVERPRVRLGTQSDAAAVRKCYARVAAGSHGLLERTERMWENQLNVPARHCFVLPDASGLRGYALVTYGRARTPEDRPLVVHELIAEDLDAYRELVSWLALQRDEWPVVHYDALPEERFDLLLAEPRPPRFTAARNLWAPVARVIRGPMLRVLDVPAALGARACWPGQPPFEFTLRVLDPELPENEGPWRVAFDGRAVDCTPVRGQPAALELGAAEFAQLFAGELSVSEALRLDRASCRVDPGPIDALFRSTRTLRLLDEF